MILWTLVRTVGLGASTPPHCVSTGTGFLSLHTHGDKKVGEGPPIKYPAGKVHVARRGAVRGWGRDSGAEAVHGRIPERIATPCWLCFPGGTIQAGSPVDVAWTSPTSTSNG